MVLTLAEQLRALGVKGILVTMAEQGDFIELRCMAEECYCPNGREYFDYQHHPPGDVGQGAAVSGRLRERVRGHSRRARALATANRESRQRPEQYRPSTGGAPGRRRSGTHVRSRPSGTPLSGSRRDRIDNRSHYGKLFAPNVPCSARS